MRRRRCALRRTLLPTLAILSLGAAAAAAPTGASAQRAPARWVVTRDAFADLWYHGLAVVGVNGYGPLPLYSAAYRADARAARRGRGAATRLDGTAAALRVELRADSAYEVLHFVPPYFVGEAPPAVLAALRSALAAGTEPRFERGPLDARAAAVVAALPTARERRTLRAFVDLLDEEWRAFVREDRVTRAPDAAAVARLQAEWDRLLAPPLAGYLDALSGGRGGVIVVVPAVGAEGRIVTGAGVWRPVVVVTAGDGGEHAAPLLAAVRELSFGLLDEADVTRDESADRLAAARARDVAAVRAGAILLEAAAPALAESYRAMFAAAAGAPSFEKQYPLDARSERGLRAAVSHHLAAAAHAARRPAQR